MVMTAAFAVLSLGTVRRLLGIERRTFYQGIALLALWLACMAAPGIIERLVG